MSAQRFCYTSELLVFVTGWVLLAACFNVDHSSDWTAAASLLGLSTLPGPLVFGAIGFAVGGRRLFKPAALCDTSVWIIANVLPAVQFVR